VKEVISKMELIEFLIAAGGCTFIITHSKLFKTFREWIYDKNKDFGNFVGCPQCVGVYCGMIVYLLMLSDLDIFIRGLQCSFLGFIVNKIIYKT